MRTQLPWFAALLLLCLLGTPSQAAVPQTIVIDGINDFDLSNAIDADSADTQFADFCTDDPELESPMDIGTVLVTNDAANLYTGATTIDGGTVNSAALTAATVNVTGGSLDSVLAASATDVTITGGSI